MKRIMALVLTLCMAFSLCACSAGPVKFDKAMETPAPTETVQPTEEPKTREERLTDDIIILYTNDVHCGVDDGQGYQGLVQMKNVLEAAGKTVLVVSAGDYIQGDVIGLLSQGEDIIKLMNDCGYIAAAVGNHEFDYGVPKLLELKDQADFPMLSCNFLDKDGNRVFDAYKIVEVNGVKIGFLGITTPTTITSSTPKYFKDDEGNYIYSFATDDDITGDAFCSYVQGYVDEMKEEGADYIIALSHLGVNADSEPYTSSAIIPKISGIDVYLDAHSHTVMEGEQVNDKDGKPVLVTQTGTKLAYVGLLDIKQNGEITSQLIDDSGIQDEIDDLNEEIDAKTETVFAHSDYNLVIMDPDNPDVRIVRSQETNLADMVADSFRDYGNADIAFVNGGGIRTEIPAGDITYKQVISVLPFENNVVVIKTTGQVILDALECGASAVPSELGGFIQVSGLTYTIDSTIESPVTKDADSMYVIDETAERRVKDVMVGGEALDPEKEYTVAGLDYMLLQNGDGYKCFDGAEVILNTNMSYLQVFINYISDNLGGVIPEEYSNPLGQGRITVNG